MGSKSLPVKPFRQQNWRRPGVKVGNTKTLRLSRELSDLSLHALSSARAIRLVSAANEWAEKVSRADPEDILRDCVRYEPPLNRTMKHVLLWPEGSRDMNIFLFL